MVSKAWQMAFSSASRVRAPTLRRNVLSGLRRFPRWGKSQANSLARTAPGILSRRVASLTFSLLWQQKRVHDHNLSCEMRCGASMDSTYCSKAAVSAAPSIIMDSPIPAHRDNQGHVLVSIARDRACGSLPFECPAVAWVQSNIGATFVNEDELTRI